jgi:NADH-quinone oxidoreductase subunit A
MGAYLPLIVLILAALAFSSAAIIDGKDLYKSHYQSTKREPYECGIPTHGKTWKQLNIGIIFLH